MSGSEPSPPSGGAARPVRTDHERIALSELVSRVVERGVVVSGDLVVSVGGVDLLYVGLDVLLATMDQVDGRTPEVRAASGPRSTEGEG